MKRTSLDQKIAYCQQRGTLKTYSEAEAVQHFTDIYSTNFREELPGHIDGVLAAYEVGKYLCSFVVPSHEERFDTVFQLNTLGNFVRDIVYFMLTD